jgi:hypothetical protein
MRPPEGVISQHRHPMMLGSSRGDLRVSFLLMVCSPSG